MAKTKHKVLDENQVHLIAEALGNPRRYEILKQLSECKTPVMCVAVRECMSTISPATLSHHMKELETAGLIQPVREGKFVSYLLRRDILEAFFARLRTDLDLA
jgi:ArsR family transcriptional regulator